MRVYHGSSVRIDEIDLSKGRWGRDFGRGFYVTNIRSQAEVWAARKGQEVGTSGVVTEYDFMEYAYEDDRLKVLRFDSYNEDWFDFIILNRSAPRNKVHDYDIVEGPVADDQVSRRIFLYQSGVLTKQEFLDELKFKKLTHQMCFCSALSLQMLTPIDTKFDAEIMLISDVLVAQLITKEHLSDDKAVNLFYSSHLYSLLINPSTEYYKKSKDELYKLLLSEF